MQWLQWSIKCHHYDLIKKLLRKSLNSEKNFNKCEFTEKFREFINSGQDSSLKSTKFGWIWLQNFSLGIEYFQQCKRKWNSSSIIPELQTGQNLLLWGVWLYLPVSTMSLWLLIRIWQETTSWLFTQGPVVRRTISANPGLNFNLGFSFFCSKALSRIIFSILFRVSNHQIGVKKMIKLTLLFKLPYLNSNLALTLGYLKPALKNPARQRLKIQTVPLESE